ncbi:MAG TPA: hypothetical protein PL174_00085 [Fervidobacterium sp.]|nr:hypothetical protein [Fervidobacterium sp.]HOP81596.1 hypothetical protein [Fervidobacterium sp.]HPC25471.1 hypothetical protein [Fervidobacterium sp.]
MQINVENADGLNLEPGSSFCIVSHSISYVERILSSIIDVNNLQDLLIIKPENNIGIEEIRRIIDFLDFAPQGEYKLILVYEADKMTQEAANAFLKTLEEPPHYAIILLITTRWNSLLPTIRSRVQKRFLKFVPQSDKLNDFERYLAFWDAEFEDRILSHDYQILAEDELADSEDVLNQVMSIKAMIDEYLQKGIAEYVKFISRVSKINDFRFLKNLTKVVAWMIFTNKDLQIEKKIEYLKICDEIQRSKLANFNYVLTYYTLLLGLRGEKQ